MTPRESDLRRGSSSLVVRAPLSATPYPLTSLQYTRAAPAPGRSFLNNRLRELKRPDSTVKQKQEESPSAHWLASVPLGRPLQLQLQAARHKVRPSQSVTPAARRSAASPRLCVHHK